MQPTEAQATAIFTPNNAIVVAGAGSGKTRVLVERYLTLLERGRSLNELVAITFTRKAAGEMRDRVRSTLERRYRAAQETDDEAAKHWGNLLGTMDSARIMTIHELCADLLRANAAQAAIDPDFQVLDEIQSNILLSDAIDDAFTQLADSAAAVFAVYDLGTIRDTLLNLDLLTTDLSQIPDDPARLLEQWQLLWETEANRTLNALRQNSQFVAAVAWDLPGGMPPGDRITEVWLSIRPHLNQLLEASGFDSLQAMIPLIKLTGGSAKAWGGKDTFDEAKAALKFIRDTAKETVEVPLDAFDAQAAELVIGWKTLITQVRDTYEKSKAKERALDFNDLELRAAQLLLDHPEVVARYQGAEFKHLLVDEFQDTNHAQWTIARHLAGEQTPGALFVVGDPKQSIYAFRGADVRVFMEVQQQIKANGGEKVDMSRSFRTHLPLVTQFNVLFQEILKLDAGSLAYAYQVGFDVPMEAFRGEAPTPNPAIELLLIDPDNAPEDKQRAEDCRRWEAQAVAQRIYDLVEIEHRLIYDKEHGVTRPVNYGDITLLFQATTSMGLYEDALRAAGIPSLTIAGRGYYDRQEVHDLLSLLRALYNPADNLSLAAALRSPLFNLSDDALYALRLMKGSLWDALNQPSAFIPTDEQAKIAFAYDCLTRLHILAGRVTISELLRTILAETGYLATLTGLPDGIQRRSNVEKLLEKAQSSGKITLSDFTYYLSDLSAKEVREGNAALDVDNTVRLMTVHASKGLEFPVVCLVDTARERGGPRNQVLVYHDGLCCKVYDDGAGKFVEPFAFRHARKITALREDAERRRLLYVAATRAQDLLLISGQANTADWKSSGWLGWLLDVISRDDETFKIDIPVYSTQRTTARPSTTLPSWQPTSSDTRMVEPPLLKPIPPRKLMLVRHLAATSIADLGSHEDAQESHAARDRFRRKVLYDAPAVIHRAKYEPHDERRYRFSARQLGDMVHDALRWWSFPFEEMDSDLRVELLNGYAWENGITDREDRIQAVERAEGLLKRFSQTDLYHWITESGANHLPILRELPFIYEREAHIVHGVMDILFQRSDGSWMLADYKTSRLRPYPKDGGQTVVNHALRQHATRYHLQVGIYAEAAQQQLAIVPEVYIHYITYDQSIRITPDEWQTALAQGLSARIIDSL